MRWVSKSLLKKAARIHQKVFAIFSPVEVIIMLMVVGLLVAQFQLTAQPIESTHRFTSYPSV